MYHGHICVMGKWDCPDGADESKEFLCGTQLYCKQMFHCQSSMRKCISLHNVCDGFQDCPLNDDEAHKCEVGCVVGCECLVHAVICSYTCIQSFLAFNTFPYVFIKIQSCAIPQPDILGKAFLEAKVFQLNKNNLTNICNFHFPPGLAVFNVENNMLVSLKTHCIINKDLLIKLYLSNNQIQDLENKCFVNLTQLALVKLDNNPLFQLGGLFAPYTNMSKVVFSVVNIFLHDIDVKAFSQYFMRAVVTSDHHICCIVPDNVTCTQKFLGLSLVQTSFMKTA